jgi:hypothetical protein
VPTRKQRKRRDKTFRHEYELVTYDEEGNETPVDPDELRAAKKKDAPKGKTQQRSGRSGRAAREVPPPTWNRALKRGGIMGGILIIVMIAISPGAIALGVLYGVALIPFTYWIDRIAYRNYLRRSGKS